MARFLLMLIFFVPQFVLGQQNVERVEQQYAKIKKKFTDVPDIEVARLAQLQPQSNLVFIDVREPEEQAVSMIPGAVTAEEFERKREQFREKTLVAYCTIGYRSGRFAKRWNERGFNGVNLAGGILAWTHEGRALETPSGNDTKRVHVYGRDWNYAPEGYIPVW